MSVLWMKMRMGGGGSEEKASFVGLEKLRE